MKKVRFWTLFFGAAILTTGIACPVLSQAVNMNEGRWEISTEMVMEGVPFQMPPTRSTQCMTKDNVVPKSSEKSDNCKVLSHSVVGNKVTWKVRCVEKDATSEGEGEIVYSGSSYKGTMSAKMTDSSGKTQAVKMKLAGKRIGDCSDTDRKDREQTRAQPEQVRAGLQDYDAKLRRAQELSKLTVPEEGAGACPITDVACERKFGRLNVQEGQWALVEEATTVTKEAVPSKSAQTKKAAKGKANAQEAPKTVYTPAEKQESVKCLSDKEATLPDPQEQSCLTEKKRSGDRVTWLNKCSYGDTRIEEQGGITYSGDHYDGVRIRKVSAPTGDSTIIAKLSGQRVGDGNCIGPERENIPEKKAKGGSQPSESEGIIDKSPVKTLKKIFGF